MGKLKGIYYNMCCEEVPFQQKENPLHLHGQPLTVVGREGDFGEKR